jgi:hypothetical protein
MRRWRNKKQKSEENQRKESARKREEERERALACSASAKKLSMFSLRTMRPTSFKGKRSSGQILVAVVVCQSEEITRVGEGDRKRVKDEKLE